MKKGFLGGLLAMVLGFGAAGSAMQFARTHKITEPKQPSMKGWRNSAPSEYFGKRSNIITANLPDGSTKRMKLKNALKHGYSFA